MTVVARPAGQLLGGAATDHPEGISDHLARLGPLPHDPGGLIAALEVADLRGRGGAGFPAWRKWRAVAAAAGPGSRPLVIANAAEGEPCSMKDRLLLQVRPHLVLDGVRAAATAVGATETYLYLHDDDRDTRAAVREAIRERGRTLPGERQPTLVSAPPRYVAGQETAAIARVEGRAARPAYLPAPYLQGAFGRPTLVQNVETLARAALVARGFDGGGFALVTVTGAVRRTSVVEIAVGTAVAGAVSATGGATGTAAGFLAGGYFGRWLRADTSWDLGLGTDVPLGAGVLAVVDTGHCPIAETARIVTYLAGESARQCGPCVNALPAMAEALTEMTRARRPRPRLDLLQRRSQEVMGRGGCRHPDGAALLVQSLLTTFQREVAHHLRNGPCRACTAPPLLPIPSSGGGWR